MGEFFVLLRVFLREGVTSIGVATTQQPLGCAATGGRLGKRAGDIARRSYRKQPSGLGGPRLDFQGSKVPLYFASRVSDLGVL